MRINLYDEAERLFSCTGKRMNDKLVFKRYYNKYTDNRTVNAYCFTIITELKGVLPKYNGELMEW